MPAAVAERVRRLLRAQRGEDAVVRDTSERQDGLQVSHFGNRRDEEVPARLDLGRRWFVLRRHAAHRVADAAVDEREAVVRMRFVFAAGEAVPQQGLVEQHAGIVAGERPAGAVGALQARRKPDDQQPRVRRPKRGHRRVEPGRLLLPPRFAEFDQSRATRAVAAWLGRGCRRAEGAYTHAQLLLEGVLVVIGGGTRRGALRRRRRPLQELRRMTRLALLARAARLAWRTFGRIAADLRL